MYKLYFEIPILYISGCNNFTCTLIIYRESHCMAFGQQRYILDMISCIFNIEVNGHVIINRHIIFSHKI